MKLFIGIPVYEQVPVGFLSGYTELL